jgi:hypothetical protein
MLQVNLRSHIILSIMSLPSPATDDTLEPISPIDPHPIAHDRGEMLLPSPVTDDEDMFDDFCVAFDNKATVARQPSNSSFFDNVYLDARHSFPRPVSAASEHLSVVIEEFKTKPLRVKKRIGESDRRMELTAVHPFAASAERTDEAHCAISSSFMSVTPPIFAQPLPPVPRTVSPTDELAGLGARRPSGPAPLPSLPSTPASSRRHDLPLTPRTPSIRWDSPMTPSRAPGKAVKLLGVTPPVPSPPPGLLSMAKSKTLTSSRLIELQTLLEPSPISVRAWKQGVDDQEFSALLPALGPPVQLSVNGRVRPAPKKVEEGQSLADFFKGEDDMAQGKAEMRRRALARARGDLTDSEDEDFFDKPKRTTGGRSALEKRLGVSMDELGPALMPKPKRPPRPEIGLATQVSPPRPKHRPPPLNLTRLPPQRGLPIINVISPSQVRGHRACKSDPNTPTRTLPVPLPVSEPSRLRTPKLQMQNRSASASAVRTMPHPSLAAPPMAMPRSVSDSGPYAFVGRASADMPRPDHVDANGQPISFFEPETPTELVGGRLKAWEGIKRAVRL